MARAQWQWRRWGAPAVLALALALAVACGDDGGGGGGGGDAAADVAADVALDGGATDVVPTPADVPADVPVPADALADVPEPADVPADAGGPGPYGFTVRVPGTHTLSCTDFAGQPFDQEFPDRDWVCTLEHGDLSAVVYVQATPTECVSVGMSSGAVYEVPGAWISVDGVVSALTAPAYDGGGNHQNDFVDFTWQGTDYRYWHSSFGWGWRVCQPMDCLQTLDAANLPIEDGCCDAAAPRSLPIVCVAVAADGAVPALVDTYAECEGHDEFSCLAK